MYTIIQVGFAYNGKCRLAVEQSFTGDLSAQNLLLIVSRDRRTLIGNNFTFHRSMRPLIWPMLPRKPSKKSANSTVGLFFRMNWRNAFNVDALVAGIKANIKECYGSRIHRSVQVYLVHAVFLN